MSPIGDTPTSHRAPYTSDEEEPAAVTSPIPGAGIAIAGVWLSCVALTIFLVWLFFVFDPSTRSSNNQGMSALLFVTLVSICLSPLILAYNLTMVLLGKRK